MTPQEILTSTHQQILTFNAEQRQMYRDVVNNEFHNKVKNAIDAGFKHIQIGYSGCILVKSNKHGIYYVTRNGKGTGANLGQYADLRDCTRSVKGNWDGHEITCQ